MDRTAHVYNAAGLFRRVDGQMYECYRLDGDNSEIDFRRNPIKALDGVKGRSVKAEIERDAPALFASENYLIGEGFILRKALGDYRIETQFGGKNATATEKGVGTVRGKLDGKVKILWDEQGDGVLFKWADGQIPIEDRSISVRCKEIGEKGSVWEIVTSGKGHTLRKREEVTVMNASSGYSLMRLLTGLRGGPTLHGSEEGPAVRAPSYSLMRLLPVSAFAVLVLAIMSYWYLGGSDQNA